jgi:hypothetical protein
MLKEWFSIIAGAALFGYGSLLFATGYTESSSNYYRGLYLVVFGLGWLGAWSQLDKRPLTACVIYYLVAFLGMGYWIIDVLAVVFQWELISWAGWDLFFLIVSYGLPLWPVVASFIIAVFVTSEL